jgi:hypothetical protein
MSKKIGKYEELLAEKQKLEVLFQAQKALVKYEIRDIRSSFEPAFNALEFLKKMTLRNTDNPVFQSGINMLIDFLSNKLQGKHAGFIRSTILPHIIKNYASHLLAGYVDDMIEQIVSLFNNEEESPAENQT